MGVGAGAVRQEAGAAGRSAAAALTGAVVVAATDFDFLHTHNSRTKPIVPEEDVGVALAAARSTGSRKAPVLVAGPGREQRQQQRPSRQNNLPVAAEEADPAEAEVGGNSEWAQRDFYAY